MKRIFSIILAVMMLLSVSLVASADGFVGMKSVAVETDTDITVTVSVYGVDTLKGFTATFANSDKLTYIADSAVADDDIANFENALKPTVKNDNSSVKFTASTSIAANYITADVVTLFTYKVAKASADIELTASDFAYATGLYKALITASAVGTYNTNLNSDKTPAIFAFEYVDARTPVTPDEPVVPDDVVLNEETFAEGASSFDVEEGATIKYGDSEITAGANAKVYTFFAKAAEALVADSYGVTATIGGKAYKFPGKADVEAGKNWAIRFVVPAGQFADGVAIDSIDNIVAY